MKAKDESDVSRIIGALHYPLTPRAASQLFFTDPVKPLQGREASRPLLQARLLLWEHLPPESC